MKRDFYALLDNQEIESDDANYFLIEPTSAQKWNSEGFGIFWTVNEFAGRRVAKNLKRLNSWYVEIDNLDKALQYALIEASPVVPNLVIESKRSLHIYWNCRDASLNNYELIQAGISHFFNGDKQVKDTSRLLRAPNYLHLKDPSDPFMVKQTSQYTGDFSDQLMIYNFPKPNEDDEQTEPRAHQLISTHGTDFWEKIYSLDQEEALKRLSGTNHVCGEVYTFKTTGSGKRNIWVDSKPSSCWIDEDKKIGSHSNGGPTIFNWLKWFNKSNRDVVQIIKEVFPEVVP